MSFGGQIGNFSHVFDGIACEYRGYAGELWCIMSAVPFFACDELM